METKMTVGERLKFLRGKKTKKQVADAIGVSYSTYVKYERNERKVNDDVKCRIAKLYGRTVQSIFFKP